MFDFVSHDELSRSGAAAQSLAPSSEKTSLIEMDVQQPLVLLHPSLTATSILSKYITTPSHANDRDVDIINIAMCRVGTVLMASRGCGHARQSGWQDSAVGTHLSSLINRCSSCKPGQTYCGKLTIDSGLDTRSGFPTNRSKTGPQLPSLASLIQFTPDSGPPAYTLDGKCKFCTTYESEIRLADQIKETLVEYNMALLSNEARVAIKWESKTCFVSIFPMLGLSEATKHSSYPLFPHG
jgi:hypothetical protein